MIRKAIQHDFDFVYHLTMHPQVNRFLFYEVMSAEQFKPIFNDLLLQDILYVFEVEGILTGMFKLRPLTHRCSHIAVLGGVAIHPSFSGKGYGHQMLQQVILHGREKGFLRMELGVSVINERAVHLYTKAGFESEGILKKYIHLKSEDVFLDDILMAYYY